MVLMKRWNGWGDENITYPLPASAASFLAEQVGPGIQSTDANLRDVLATVPDSRLAAHPLINVESLERLQHARGQSLADWVALRSGHIGAFPDGVAYPSNSDEIKDLLDYAAHTGTRLVPYGGGTSVVGHINPLPGASPCLTLDLSRLDKLLEWDETSRLASFEAGIVGPQLENQLNQLGFTLGHFPQSFEYSTLGGWVATRSCGQQSYYYGRIEDLFAGGTVETPLGPLILPPLPASAAGPDLRQLVLGSEGRIGIITQATVRVRPLAEIEAFYGLFFRAWEEGINALREFAQARIPISMARLSDAQETETTLILSGKERLVNWAERGLQLIGYGPQRCLLILGITGDRKTAGLARSQAFSIARAHGGLAAGTLIGNMWRKSRFLTPYLRNTLWEKGYALDTLETALPWKDALSCAVTLKDRIRSGLEDLGERVLVFAHLSHIYRDGASIYVTYLFRRAEDPDEVLHRWERLKSAASQAIIDHHGTISHQHGVGLDHVNYLPAEKGELGIKALTEMMHTFDPKGMLNPGKLMLEKQPMIPGGKSERK